MQQLQPPGEQSFSSLLSPEVPEPPGVGAAGAPPRSSYLPAKTHCPAAATLRIRNSTVRAMVGARHLPTVASACSVLLVVTHCLLNTPHMCPVLFKEHSFMHIVLCW
jgi:hypothetical protein